MTENQVFARRAFAEPRVTVFLRRAILSVVAAHVTLAMWSGYRAIVQVFRLDVRASAPVLGPGATVGYDVHSSGRAPVTVRLELIQRGRAETLAVRRVRDNDIAVYDPRTITGSYQLALPATLLSRFSPGPAIVRATAIGTSQFLRVPPPTVREMRVTLRPEVSGR